MFRFSRRIIPCLTTISVTAASLRYNTSSNDSEKHRHPNHSSSIILSLSKESIDNIQNHLESIGHKGYHINPQVVISRSTADKPSRQLQSLFCQRMAFRLKGIAQVVDVDTISIYGRVSHHTGELRDSANYQPAVIVMSSMRQLDTFSIQQYEDLPSQIPSLLETKEEVCVSIPGDEHSIRKVVIHPFTWDQQIVVEGQLCDTNHIDKDGKCLFDKEHDNLDSLGAYDHEVEQVVTIPLKAAHAEDEQETCALCRYMKKGSCKDQFIAWDKCMSSLKENDPVTLCSTPTYELFRCMTNDEYYDIMTVNSHNILPALEKSIASKNN